MKVNGAPSRLFWKQICGSLIALYHTVSFSFSAEKAVFIHQVLGMHVRLGSCLMAGFLFAPSALSYSIQFVDFAILFAWI